MQSFVFNQSKQPDKSETTTPQGSCQQDMENQKKAQWKPKLNRNRKTKNRKRNRK